MFGCSNSPALHPTTPYSLNPTPYAKIETEFHKYAWHICGLFHERLERLSQHSDALLFAPFAIALEVDAGVGVLLEVGSPGGGSVGCDDRLAALQGFGDDTTEVLREGREAEDVGPGPVGLQLLAGMVGDDLSSRFATRCARGIRLRAWHSSHA